MENKLRLLQGFFWSFGCSVVLSTVSLAIMWATRGFHPMLTFVKSYYVLQLGVLTLLLLPVVMKFSRPQSDSDR